MDMNCRYRHKKNSKSEPPGIKLMINGGLVTFEKQKVFKAGQCLNNSAYKTRIIPGKCRETTI